MALSEQEQRLLEEMERNLYKHEADIVSASDGPRVVDYTRVAIGVLMLVVGLGLIVVGVAMQLLILGVAGFGLAVSGALVALSASKPQPASPAAAAPGAPPSAPKRERSTLMDRLSDEWDKRQQ